MVMVSQCYKCTKNYSIVYLKRRIVWYINYTSIKLSLKMCGNKASHKENKIIPMADTNKAPIWGLYWV